MELLPFRPGLVAGHCIGVDPYYLPHKAQEVGYHPKIILAGRRLNDNMGAYVANQLIKPMIKHRLQIEGAKILVMGLTFKENCLDLCNTRVVDIVAELKDYSCEVDVYDPWVTVAEAKHENGITPITEPMLGTYDSIVLSVAHHQFKAMGVGAIRALGTSNHILYDLKYIFPANETDIRL